MASTSLKGAVLLLKTVVLHLSMSRHLMALCSSTKSGTTRLIMKQFVILFFILNDNHVLSSLST